MRALKWLTIVVIGGFVALVLIGKMLPPVAVPASYPGITGTAARGRLGPAELQMLGMQLGGMEGCGYDSSWINGKRDRVRADNPSAFARHFEPAYHSGYRLARSASAATCADMNSRGRDLLDTLIGR